MGVPNTPEAISAVPGVDLTDLKARKSKISADLMAAATKVGFFYVTGKSQMSVNLALLLKSDHSER